MPSEKSARVSVRKAQYNRRVKRTASAAVTGARKAISSGNVQDSTTAVRLAASTLDLAAKRRAIHPNSASRRKSSIAKGLHRIST
jgi:small subunit ribosomal protein S20